MVILRSVYNMKDISLNLFKKGPKWKYSSESGKLQYVDLWLEQICRHSEKEEIIS